MTGSTVVIATTGRAARLRLVTGVRVAGLSACAPLGPPTEAPPPSPAAAAPASPSAARDAGGALPASPARTAPVAAAPSTAAATSSPAATPAAVPSPVLQAPILPLDEAVLRAANDLFSRAQVPPAATGRHAVVIDPLVDGLTGAQSLATRSMETRIGDLVRGRYPAYEIQPFSIAAVTRAPLLMVGTFTTINGQGQTTGERDAYRICLALADLRSGRIVAKGVARARIAGVDGTPLPFFADSPVLSPDPVTDGYIRTCQGTKVGDTLDAAYWDALIAAAMIGDAIAAYDDGRYEDALDLYRGALRLPAGDQLRVYNGLYLTNWKLGRREEATQAFGRIVEFGLAHRRLAVKFLFGPGSTQFIADPKVNAPYRFWLRQLATHTGAKQSCLDVVGHTSRSGPEPLNDRLSLLRAQYVKQRLENEVPTLRDRTRAFGKGSQEALIGIGTDDGRDALDRRVEFRVANC